MSSPLVDAAATTNLGLSADTLTLLRRCEAQARSMLGRLEAQHAEFPTQPVLDAWLQLGRVVEEPKGLLPTVLSRPARFLRSDAPAVRLFVRALDGAIASAEEAIVTAHAVRRILPLAEQIIGTYTALFPQMIERFGRRFPKVTAGWLSCPNRQQMRVWQSALRRLEAEGASARQDVQGWPPSDLTVIADPDTGETVAELVVKRARALRSRVSGTLSKANLDLVALSARHIRGLTAGRAPRGGPAEALADAALEFDLHVTSLGRNRIHESRMLWAHAVDAAVDSSLWTPRAHDPLLQSARADESELHCLILDDRHVLVTTHVTSLRLWTLQGLEPGRICDVHPVSLPDWLYESGAVADLRTLFSGVDDDSGSFAMTSAAKIRLLRPLGSDWLGSVVEQGNLVRVSEHVAEQRPVVRVPVTGGLIPGKPRREVTGFGPVRVFSFQTTDRPDLANFVVNEVPVASENVAESRALHLLARTEPVRAPQVIGHAESDGRVGKLFTATPAWTRGDAPAVESLLDRPDAKDALVSQMAGVMARLHAEQIALGLWNLDMVLIGLRASRTVGDGTLTTYIRCAPLAAAFGQPYPALMPKHQELLRWRALSVVGPQRWLRHHEASAEVDAAHAAILILDILALDVTPRLQLNQVGKWVVEHPETFHRSDLAFEIGQGLRSQETWSAVAHLIRSLGDWRSAA